MPTVCDDLSTVRAYHAAGHAAVVIATELPFDRLGITDAYCAFCTPQPYLSRVDAAFPGSKAGGQHDPTTFDAISLACCAGLTAEDIVGCPPSQDAIDAVMATIPALFAKDAYNHLKVEAYLDAVRRRARELLAERWKSLRLLAEHIHTHQEIDATAAFELVSGGVELRDFKWKPHPYLFDLRDSRNELDFHHDV